MNVRTVVATVVLALASLSCAANSGGATRDGRVELLAAACDLGDFNACDELAVEYGATAESQEFGATCGGERAVPAGSCLDLLGTTTTLPPSVDPGCLGVGSRGDEVRDLQQRLNAAGADPPLVVDGEFGPRTASAVEARLGKDTFCASDSEAIRQQQTDYVEVPDVRRQATSSAEAALQALSVTATSSARCSDLVEPGAVVAVQFQRDDGTTLTLFDAETPVNSETLLIPPGRTVDLVVSDGPCGPAPATSVP